MKVALVYDRVNKWGGAERVLIALHELFPKAPLYTSVYSKKHAPWAEVFPNVHTSFLQNIPFTHSRHELLPLFMPKAFESLNFDKYDLVISVTSEAAKGIITNRKTKHLCYCLTPTRYLWSGYDVYFSADKNKRQSILNRVQDDTVRKLSSPLVNHLRKWDKIAAKRPHQIVGISKEVQRRIKKYYGRESELIYPPVDTSRFKIQDSRCKNEKRWIPDRAWNNQPIDYYLVVSRLVPYKKVDLVIEVFNELNIPLLIVGKGSQEKKLKLMAKQNIQFIKDLSDKDLHSIYNNAKCLIFPQEEDFGLTAVEAQMHGTPVIAFKKGGALETVVDRKTGIFFNEQRSDSLKRALARFKNSKFNVQDLRNNAKKFSGEKFKKKFTKVIEKVLTH